jgi:glutamate decarboxylase
MASGRTNLAALRVVVRRGFTHATADLLPRDLNRLLPRLEKQPAPVHDGTGAGGFHH